MNGYPLLFRRRLFRLGPFPLPEALLSALTSASLAWKITPSLELEIHRGENLAGYSGTPLLKKLGIQDTFRLHVLNAPRDYFKSLGKLPPGVQVLSSPGSPMDFIHFFTKDRKEYEKRLPGLKKTLAQGGMIWVSWPKASSKVATDVTENVVREYGLKTGLVDIKVCAVDDTWSGLKFVIPVKDRKK